jgi:hypothetical protein
MKYAVLHLRVHFTAYALCGRPVSGLLVTRATHERFHSKKYPRCKTCLRVWNKKKRGGTWPT